MKFYIVSVVLIVTLFGCGSREKRKPSEKPPITIVSLPALSWTDTLKGDTGVRLAKFDYYLVKCDGFDSSGIRAGIDRFARNIQATQPNSYAQYNMLFFKESEETNEKNLVADKDIIDAYSTKHDLIYEFVWNYNELIGIYKYSNGLIINPESTIRIDDANSSVH